MSIAVSVSVRPSRVMLTMLVMAVLGASAIGVLLLSGAAGDAPLSRRLSVAAIAFFLASFGFYHGIRHRETLHIDISGTGQIRLSKVDRAAPCAEADWPHVGQIGEVVRLADNSTIWPHLLLLRLRTESGKMTTVPIFPDCVSRDAFRALSVACRWIASGKEADPRGRADNFPV